MAQPPPHPRPSPAHPIARRSDISTAHAQRVQGVQGAQKSASSSNSFNFTSSSSSSSSSLPHQQSRATSNISPAKSATNANSSNTNNAAATTSSMIGPSAPWNGNLSGIPQYPPQETFDAEYQAFLSSYQPNDSPNANMNASGGGGGVLNAPGSTRYNESRDSTSDAVYGQPNYASPDSYPPGGSHINPATVDHTHPAHLSGLPSHPGHHISSSSPGDPMYALSPESFSSGESPHSLGMSIPHQTPPQAFQYYPQEPQPFYAAINTNNSQSYASYGRDPWSSPPMQNEFANLYSNGNDPSSHGHPAYAQHARPPALSSYPQYTQQQPPQPPQRGVAPEQINKHAAGGPPRGGMSANVGINQGQMNIQPQMPGRAMATAVSRKDGTKLETNFANTGRQSGTQANKSSPSKNSTGKNSTGARPPAPSTKSTKKRKVDPEPYDDSDDSEDDYEEIAVPGGAQRSGAASGGPQRLPGACGPCKRLKMKCLFLEGESACQRCKNSGRGNQCVVGPRKPRQPSNKKELLIQKLREKDAVIESLLKQLQNPRPQINLKDAPRLSPSLSSSLPQGTPNEKEIDKDILEWIQRAQNSVRSTNRDGTAYRIVDGISLEDDDSLDSGSSEGANRTLDSHLSPSKSSVSDSGRSSGRGKGGLHAPDQPNLKSSPKLHSLPLPEAPVGLLADLALGESKEKERERRRSRSRSKSGSASGAGGSDKSGGKSKDGDDDDDGEDDGQLGVASRNYFQPGPAARLGLRTIQIERRNIPEIMTSGLISPAEVDKLFKIFFDKLNVFVSILDPIMHTPATIFGRCPFLFTVVCAISSRYYTERPELYSIAMHFARTAAASSLIEGAKSVELCQAYILMSVYSLPSRRWEDAREWLYLGLAIRMATDLNLHVPTTTKILNEQHEREIRNRTRTWLICYNLDRSSSAQLGKPASIRADLIIRTSKDWWKRSPYHDPFDLHLCAYSDLLWSIVAKFQEEVYSDPKTTTGLNTDMDLVQVGFRYDQILQTWKAQTAVSFAANSESSSQCQYRVQLLPFYVNYLRLVILSLGFQQTLRKGIETISQGADIVERCIDAASSVVRVVVNDLAPTEYFRYAPDGHFVFASFASAFLIKLLRPEYKELIDGEHRTRIIGLVESLVDVLKSPRNAVDGRHTPMLYSRFLAGLLAKYKQDEEMVDGTSASSDSAASQGDSLHTPPQESVKQEATSPANGAIGAAKAASKHRPSPSIEIIPPAPESVNGKPAQAPAPHIIYYPTPDNTQQVPQSQFNPFNNDTSQNATNSLFPHGIRSDDTKDSNTTSAASTVQPDDTVHGGSQFGAQDAIMTDDQMLAPMLAMDNPAFWSHMMLPGFSWPSDEPWGINVNMDMNDMVDMSGMHDFAGSGAGAGAAQSHFQGGNY